MTFYTEPRVVPATLRTSNLYLEMLAPKHVKLDYEAFMSSWQRLHIWGGGRWPHADFTLAENLKDMQMHMREFQAREAFAYTVMNTEQTRVEGCVYINPLAGWFEHYNVVPPERIEPDAAYATYWVRDDALERDLDRELLAGLLDWFPREWAFSRALFIANRNQLRDMDEFEQAGLKRLWTFETPRPPGRFHFYGFKS